MEIHDLDVCQSHEVQPLLTISCLYPATSQVDDEGRRLRVYKPLTGVLIPLQSVGVSFLFLRQERYRRL